MGILESSGKRSTSQLEKRMVSPYPETVIICQYIEVEVLLSMSVFQRWRKLCTSCVAAKFFLNTMVVSRRVGKHAIK